MIKHILLNNMDIYFVRHGQTDGNVAHRHQHPDIALNNSGKAQAALVAEVIARLKPTHIITSTKVRAVETGMYISRTSHIIPETYAYFEEVRRPMWLIGKRFYEWKSLSYAWGWFFGVNVASMHDGESYDAVLERLRQARQYLEQLPVHSRVVVVSHSLFINLFLEHMNRPKRMGLCRALVRFIAIFRIKNTAVVQVQFFPKNVPRWQLIKRF